MRDMILKRINEGGRTIFKLRFGQSTGLCQPCAEQEQTSPYRNAEMRVNNIMISPAFQSTVVKKKGRKTL